MEGDPDVPSFFICPISLQIMKDPVTISTGITFDRESIQKWLFSYQKTTCPVTKQALSNFLLTPNSNLLRLIQSWRQSSSSENDFPKKPKQEDQALLMSKISLKLLLEDINKPHLQVKVLAKIKAFVRENGDIRKWIGDNSLFSHVAPLVTKTSQTVLVGETPLIIDEAVSVLCLLKPSKETLKTVSENANGLFIRSLCSTVVQSLTSYNTRIQAVSLLKSVFNVVFDDQKTGIKSDFFESMTEILKDQNSKQGTLSVLKILIELLPLGRNKEKAIKAGFVPILVELLAEKNEKQVYEMMLFVLEKLCKKADGRAAFLAHPLGIAAVLSKILMVSQVGNEKVISLLLLIFRFCDSSKVAQEFMEVGGATKICMAMQSGCSSNTKDKAREILGFHIKTWNKSPCFPHCFKSIPI